MKVRWKAKALGKALDEFESMYVTLGVACCVGLGLENRAEESRTQRDRQRDHQRGRQRDHQRDHQRGQQGTGARPTLATCALELWPENRD